MPDKGLAPAQRAVLLALMIKAGPVELRSLDKLKIKFSSTRQRTDLVDAKLITVKGKPDYDYLTLELTEAGWAWAIKELSASVPEDARGAPAGTLYLLLGVLRQHFENHNLSAAEFFSSEMREAAPAKPTAKATPAPAARSGFADEDLDSRVRKAYAEITPEPGAWVMLEDIRHAVGDAAKSSVDEALRRLGREPDVSLIPESNQKVLTAGQRAAAVRIGNQDVHLLAVGR